MRALGVSGGVLRAFGTALILSGACAVPEEPSSQQGGVDQGGEAGEATIAGGGSTDAGSSGAPAGGTAGLAGSAGGTEPSAGTAGEAEGGSSSSGAGGSPGGTGSGGVAGASVAGSPSAGTAPGGAGSNVGGSASGAGGTAAGSAGKASAGMTAGGAAGSGVGGTAGTGACGAVVACLVHRYSFGGTGTTVTDSVGNANGTVVNATLGGGQVTLAGGTSDQHVNLPPGMFSSLTSATFEVWLTWSGGSAWQRIFDFGANDGAGAGSQGTNGTSYLFLTPRAVNSSGRLRVAFSLAGPAEETFIDASAALPTSGSSHVAVVLDDSAGTLELYLDGASAGSSALDSSLSSLSVVNAWLGRSQFASDPEFAGTIQEFRVYSVARTSAQVSASFTAGPDSTPSN